MLPTPQAMCTGVQPESSTKSSKSIFFKKGSTKSTIFSWFIATAQCKGVLPSESLEVASLLFSDKSPDTMSGLPSRAAS